MWGETKWVLDKLGVDQVAIHPVNLAYSPLIMLIIYHVLGPHPGLLFNPAPICTLIMTKQGERTDRMKYLKMKLLKLTHVIISTS